MKTTEAILAYVEQMCPAPSDLLNELELYTIQKVYNPQMVSGKYQGRFLSLCAKLKQPKKILDIGTYTGYSALCLAEGLAQGGKLISIDRNEETLSIAKKFIHKSEYKNQIELVHQDAIDWLKSANSDAENLDLVFMDANKKRYSEYLDLLYPKLNTGALLLIDNTLWKGMVCQQGYRERDPMANALDEFNQYLIKAYQGKIEAILLPLKDGIFMCRKLD